MNAIRTNRIVSILAALSIVASAAHAQNPARSPAPSLARQPAQKTLPADSVELGRKYAYWFLAGMADSLVAHMTPDLLESIGGRAGVKEGQDQVTMRAGIELNAPEERFAWRNGNRQYWRTMQMSTFDGLFLLRFVLLEDGRIAGIGMGPASGAPPVDSGGAPLKKP